MNSVEKVKAICKERKIAISRLEKDLGYANGYIGQLRKGTFPDDRLVEIANYLNVTTDYLLGTEEKATAEVGSGIDEKYVKYLNFILDASERDLAIIDAMIEAKKKEEAGK